MIKEIKLDENLEWYTTLYERASYKTIYHAPGYLLAEQAGEKYQTYLYILEENDDYVVFPSLKRRINDLPWMRDFEGEYYDLVTPHEYSGVIASKYDEALIRKFYRELREYCTANRIVFSFIRFNPYTKEHELAEGYHVQKSGDQTWVDLDKDDFTESFSPKCQGKLRRAGRAGLTCERAGKDEKDIAIFCTMYQMSMHRLSAKSFFYFSDGYFNRLMKLPYVYMYFTYVAEKPCAGCLFLLEEYSGRAYYHLSCREISLSPPGTMEFLLYHAFLELRRKGYTQVHLGGGPTEALRDFKRKFSPNLVEFIIGNQVFDPTVYEMLSQKYLCAYPEERDSGFMPLYRSME